MTPPPAPATPPERCPTCWKKRPGSIIKRLGSKRVFVTCPRCGGSGNARQMAPVLERLIERARRKVEAMTPAEREAMLAEQRKSYVRAEIGSPDCAGTGQRKEKAE